MSADVHTVTNVDNRKFAMWTLITSECFLFGTLIANYMINRNHGVSGPKPTEIFNIPVTTISTFDLLMSSVAMVLALYYSVQRNAALMRLWVGVTALFGLVFLGFQYYEFSSFVHEGLGLSTNVFGASFFLLTGCHGTHVAVGVIWLTSYLITSLVKGKDWFNPEMLEVAGLYWHFVDVVWIVIFTAIYLVPYH